MKKEKVQKEHVSVKQETSNKLPGKGAEERQRRHKYLLMLNKYPLIFMSKGAF